MGAAWTDDVVAAHAIGASANAVRKHRTMTGSGAAFTTPSDTALRTHTLLTTFGRRCVSEKVNPPRGLMRGVPAPPLTRP